MDLFRISENQEDYYLIGGRLAPYKRVDIVIKAFNKLDKKLKIFGDGVDIDRLKDLAGNNKNIEFIGRVSDEEMAKLYRKCIAFLNPQEEDFGITTVEAMASGRPVIAYKRGGATETVVEDVTGTFFKEQTPEAIIETIKNFDPDKYNPQEIRERAMWFSTDGFKSKIKNFIEEEYGKFKSYNS